MDATVDFKVKKGLHCAIDCALISELSYFIFYRVIQTKPINEQTSTHLQTDHGNNANHLDDYGKFYHGFRTASGDLRNYY